MAQIVVKARQSLADIAVMHLGTIEKIYELAHTNGISLTDEPTAGTVLELPETGNKRVTAMYAINGWIPATATTGDDGGELLLEGIGYWAIGTDFIVN